MSKTVYSLGVDLEGIASPSPDNPLSKLFEQHEADIKRTMLMPAQLLEPEKFSLVKDALRRYEVDSVTILPI